ncbi:hypothetical protein PHYPSEUDO_007601 [Phytophthora pseudosyringae]|uniref:Uncharacterized protein n=1 Tax=Phytophthora pseudosyringae TaxID=221518 RepID=A0A8T1VJ72_9STRA|nr:hypothetical protein PHYPSEUDO_007601 [Phytophthora pseudosyringae]
MARSPSFYIRDSPAGAEHRADGASVPGAAAHRCRWKGQWLRSPRGQVAPTCGGLCGSALPSRRLFRIGRPKTATLRAVPIRARTQGLQGERGLQCTSA